MKTGDPITSDHSLWPPGPGADGWEVGVDPQNRTVLNLNFLSFDASFIPLDQIREESGWIINFNKSGHYYKKSESRSRSSKPSSMDFSQRVDPI